MKRDVQPPMPASRGKGCNPKRSHLVQPAQPGSLLNGDQEDTFWFQKDSLHYPLACEQCGPDTRVTRHLTEQCPFKGRHEGCEFSSPSFTDVDPASAPISLFRVLCFQTPNFLPPLSRLLTNGE
jgi:hypothetical protein